MEPYLVGSMLALVGGILLITSIVMILVGHYRTRHTSITQTVEYHDARPFADTTTGKRLSHIPFRLRYDTTISGKITSSRGAFEFYLNDFYGWIPPPTPGQWAQLSHVKQTFSSPDDKKEFKVSLEPGDYCMFFRTDSKLADANIELSLTYHKKPLKQLVDVGLSILQVAIPILVTGFIIYAGLSST